MTTFQGKGSGVGATSAAAGGFEAGDDPGVAWDEASAILRACEDLDGVMETIRDAESPAEARRALRLGFGFTGGQADALLTLPVMAFTRSERDRIATPAPAPAPAPEPAPAPDFPPLSPASSDRAVRRSAGAQETAGAVLDAQIGELCDAIAGVLGVTAPDAHPDDPRRSFVSADSLLDGCDVTDEAGLRTLLWHLHRTGLESVEGLLPFADALPVARGFEVQAERFEHAMTAGRLGSRPGGDASWAGRLWPIAQRAGYGYAVSYRRGPDSGAVWAYGGSEPLQRVWDSVVDLLIDLYQGFTAGSACDSALPLAADGRVVWTDLS